MHPPRPALLVLIASASSVLAFAGGCQSGGPSTAPTWRQAAPGVRVDLDRRMLAVDAEFCLDRGILEYVAVAEGGKEYESLLRLKARPSQLHAALLIAGYEQGALPPDLRGDFDPNVPAAERAAGAPPIPAPPTDANVPVGVPATVRLTIELKEKEGCDWRRYPIERFLIRRRTGAPPERLAWAFTGSFFARPARAHHEVYIADLERSVAALWYDPSAVFNLQADVGNPYRGDAEGLHVNEDAVPPLETPVRLIISPSDVDQSR